MYKTQSACIIIITFIGILYFTSYSKKNKSSICFSYLLIFSFLQLLFDVISVYTVNHLETVSPVINRIIHDIYLGLMLSLFYIVYKYLEMIIEEEIGDKIKRYNLTIVPYILTLLGVAFLPLSYVHGKKTNYSFGPAAYMAYLGVVVYVAFIIRLMLRYSKTIPKKKKRAIIGALMSEIPVAIYQMIFPESLITCLGIVLLNLGIYMTTENPDALLVEQLEKEKKRADVANASKTNFLANMSHEIRTPITAVMGMNELILRETKESATKQYAKDIQGAAKSLLSIINDILDITKIEAGKLTVITEEYDFNQVVKDVTNMIAFNAKVKNLDFEVLVDEHIPRGVMGDDIRLRQILVNLLNNAVKYTHEGTVTLEIRLLPSENEKIAKISFLVKDTGIGIKEEDLRKLCTPFERIEEKRNRNIEGTGLGMSITKQLLELLKSELCVSSVYGEGSEFSFVLEQEIVDAEPIGKMEEEMELADEEFRQVFEAPDAKILVVDDNELNRKVFAGLIKGTKIQIDEGANGKECIEKVKENAYDIIFLDHMMPEMDGVEALHIMKEMDDFPSKDAPVVVLTANAIVGAKEKYLKEGFYAFLEKPIDSQKLENMLLEMLDDSLIKEASTPVAKQEPERKELPFVEGLDWMYARTHFHDDEHLVDAVAFFVQSIFVDAKELEHLFADIQTEAGRKEYRIKVHSMKNSAATIGIVPLAGMAKVLEDAARNGEVEVLEAMTPIFLERWNGYREKLDEFAPECPEDSKKSALEFPEEVEELLQKIRSAAEDMDIDGLDQLWNQLNEYQFEADRQEALEKIQKAIVAFDVDFLQVAEL